MLTSNVPAIAVNAAKFGSRSPFSHRQYPRREIPNASAAACCVNPRSIRVSRSRRPNAMSTDSFILTKLYI